MRAATVLATLSATVLAVAAAARQAELRVVPELDYQRYSGTWFEVARLPFRYQKDCASDVTASYAPRPDGRITVTNRCLRADGTVQEAEGVARRAAGQPPSVLKVRFAPAFLSFLPMVWGDYQVIALGAAYDYAVVATPDRSCLWILSRTPRMDGALYREIVQQAESQGFDVSRLIQTPHTASPGAQ
jgi:apolipoprotein D and lipocalin family protein